MEQCNKTLLSNLLSKRWLLPSPESKIHKISLAEFNGPHKAVGPLAFCYSNNNHPYLGDIMEKIMKDRFFYVVRDDLLHPLVNGNKARKLDALLPLVENHAVTDVVTCGGCQSAHAAAVAVSCAERGLRSHLLLRGEQPEISTGYNLISTMYGNVTYISRSVYARREEMLTKHADFVAGTSLLRLVEHLSQNHLFGKGLPLKIVVDAGTGTTAVGLGLGALCLGLPWEVTAIMLADTIDGYREQEKQLISEFKRLYGLEYFGHILNGVEGGIVQWVERLHPRKFGNVLKGEVEVCRQIAQQTGILVDPIYTLAAWELATLLCQPEAEGDAKVVVMLHTGGTHGMFGLAQRYKSYFHPGQQKNSHFSL